MFELNVKQRRRRRRHFRSEIKSLAHNAGRLIPKRPSGEGALWVRPWQEQSQFQAIQQPMCHISTQRICFVSQKGCYVFRAVHLFCQPSLGVSGDVSWRQIPEMLQCMASWFMMKWVWVVNMLWSHCDYSLYCHITNTCRRIEFVQHLVANFFNFD